LLLLFAFQSHDLDYVEQTLEAGNYVILPCSFDSGQNGDFQIRYDAFIFLSRYVLRFT
jgi:hypothetical protein